jgi:hypothetical protein
MSEYCSKGKLMLSDKDLSSGKLNPDTIEKIKACQPEYCRQRCGEGCLLSKTTNRYLVVTEMMFVKPN